MTDLTTLRRTNAAALTGGIRREVVVQHEALAVFTRERIDDLLITSGTQGCHNQSLRFTASKQRRTMGARKHARTDGDRTDRARIAPVDPRLAGQNTAANDARLDVEEKIADRGGIRCAFARGQHFDRFLRDFVDALRAQLLAGDAKCFLQVGFDQRVEFFDQRFILRSRRPIPLWLPGFLYQLIDRRNNRLHMIVAVDHRTEHDFFRQDVSFRLNHQNGRLRSGNNEVKLAALELGQRRVEYVLAVDVADARCANRSVKRDTRDGHRGRRADHCGNVRVNFRIERHHHRHDLYFVVEAFREQRTQRTIDQTRGQRLFFRWTSLTLEETARNLACGIGLFDVINCQRKEILARLDRLVANHADQHDGVIH